VPPQV